MGPGFAPGMKAWALARASSGVTMTASPVSAHALQAASAPLKW